MENKKVDLSVILPVNMEDEGCAISARDLHRALSVPIKFNDWIRNVISKSNFIENEDYVVIRYDNSGNEIPYSDTETFVRKKEYAITIDMAKHISLMDTSKRGKIVRSYFIDIEKRYRKEIKNRLQNNTPSVSLESIEYDIKKHLPFDPDDKIETLKAFVRLMEEERSNRNIIENLRREINNRNEELVIFNNYAKQSLEDTIDLNDAAKEMTAFGIKIGPRLFIDYLCEIRFLLRRPRGFTISQSAINKNYAVYRRSSERLFGQNFMIQKIFITRKGFQEIVKAIHGICKDKFLHYGSFYSDEEVESLTSPF